MIRRAPVAAFGVGAMLLGVGVAAQQLTATEHLEWVARLTFDPEALRSVRIWTLPLATLFQADPGLGLHFLLLLAGSVVSVALCEMRAGRRLALAVFFVGDWLASFMKLGLLGVFTAAGAGRASVLLRTPDTGSSAAATAALAAAVVMYRGRAAIALGTMLAAWLVYGFLRFRLDVGLVHAGGALGGAAVVITWRRVRKDEA